MRSDLALDKWQAVTRKQNAESIPRKPAPAEPLDNGVRFARGLLIASALSTPIWLAVALLVM